MDKIINIIIIEDHPVVRNGLSAFFTATGRWKISGIAASLAEAKKMLTAVQTDIVLLDIQLEDGWGLDIIPWLVTQSEQKTNPLPLFAVYSAFDDYAHVRAALSMGVKAYVTKRRSEQKLENAQIGRAHV